MKLINVPWEMKQHVDESTAGAWEFDATSFILYFEFGSSELTEMSWVCFFQIQDYNYNNCESL